MTFEQIQKDFRTNPAYINGRLYQDVAVDEWMRQQIDDRRLLETLREIKQRRRV